MVERGEEVVLARHGKPVARIVPLERQGIALGSGRREDGVADNDTWWQPMSDEEADSFADGGL